MATTHFQPTDARRAFPCFDEPALKAKISLKIIRHKDFKSWGNMEIKTPNQTVTGESDWRMDTFEESVAMSTYLVAFVVSKFESVKNVTNNGVTVEVAGRPEAINNAEGDFALK